eukprot:1188766-Prorocentrum_minimum.AAC.1
MCSGKPQSGDRSTCTTTIGNPMMQVYVNHADDPAALVEQLFQNFLKDLLAETHAIEVIRMGRSCFNHESMFNIKVPADCEGFQRCTIGGSLRRRAPLTGGPPVCPHGGLGLAWQWCRELIGHMAMFVGRPRNVDVLTCLSAWWPGIGLAMVQGADWAHVDVPGSAAQRGRADLSVRMAAWDWPGDGTGS